MQIQSYCNEEYPVGILWNTGNKYAREVMLKIAIMEEVIQVKVLNLKNEYRQFVFDCYEGDTEAYNGGYIYEKIENMNANNSKIVAFVLQINNPTYTTDDNGKNQCIEARIVKKRIFTIHTNPFEYELAWGKKSYNKVIEIMKKYKNNELTKFVAPSRFYAKEYSKLTDCYISFIPHAIDIKRLETEKTKEDINKQYNLSNEKLKVIVPSRLEPQQKQPQLLLEACCLMNDEEKLKYEIIYTGLDKQYEKFVDSLMLKAKENNVNIRIIRFDYMSEVYKIADICILPSKSESFGYSALESLSLGIFTILNDIPTFNEIVEENNNYYIFKNNKEELKNKLLYVINNYDEFERKLPKEQWRKRYSMDRFEKAYIDVIKRII